MFQSIVLNFQGDAIDPNLILYFVAQKLKIVLIILKKTEFIETNLLIVK